MPHQVLCSICRERFDRDKQEFVQTGSRRYAHADCALREAERTKSPIPEIINPLDSVICIYCRKPLHRKDKDCVKITDTKYAHADCVEVENNRELTDSEKLDRYIENLFKTDYVSARIRKQINSFIEDYGFSYSGILKSLIYFYEVKGNSIEKSKNGIGIVPYIYQDAKNYYYSIWLAKQKNEAKRIEEYVPEEKEIHIKSPQRNVKKRPLFSFLDEEEEF